MKVWQGVTDKENKKLQELSLKDAVCNEYDINVKYINLV
jgi:hypothetical protein